MKRLLFILLLLPVFAEAQIITTVAGNGILGYSGDGGAATSAKLHLPNKAILDENGNLFIADTWGHRIRKVDHITNTISTIAGTGVAGYNGDNIAATSAQLWEPVGLAIDNSGNLYIADPGNERIRKIDASTGMITAFAGNGVGASSGFGAYSGDGGQATNASLNNPIYITIGTTIDGNESLYIGDKNNRRVRKVNMASGIITTIAGVGTWGYSGDGGSATAAQFNLIEGVTVDASGNLFVCDTNSTIRKVNTSTGIITTVAGIGTSGYTGDSAPATAAEILNPYDIAFDAEGNYYIAEFLGRIRKVDTFGIIHTVAGTSVYGYNGDGIPATSAELNESAGVSTDACGNLYIADASNERIRKVTYPPILTIPTITLSGIPNTSIGALVTITATVTNAGSSYLIHWLNHGIQFTTTTVPSVTYTKPAGADTITARVVSTATYGCYDSTTSAWHTVSATTGVASPGLPEGGVIVYPNPASDVLHIILAGSNITTIAITNLLGQTMYSHEYNTSLVQVDIADLPKGIYFVKVNGPDSYREVRKFVKL